VDRPSGTYQFTGNGHWCLRAELERADVESIATSWHRGALVPADASVITSARGLGSVANIGFSTDGETQASVSKVQLGRVRYVGLTVTPLLFGRQARVRDVPCPGPISATASRPGLG
jgi:hypothetical protein